MSIKDIRSDLDKFASDIKLNLGNVLSEEGSQGLSKNQIYGIALSCVYTTRNKQFIEAISSEASDVLSKEEVEAAKTASTIMAMTNIYYRFIHLSEDKDFSTMPANLRMNVIKNPGISNVDFELYSLSVSIINGCGMCINSHIKEALKSGTSKLGIQSTARIAAVINATAQALVIPKTN